LLFAEDNLKAIGLTLAELHRTHVANEIVVVRDVAEALISSRAEGDVITGSKLGATA
jgi:hypothetical protein